MAYGMMPVVYIMGRRIKPMNTLSIVDARNKMADALNRVSYGGERVYLARRGKPVAVLVSLADAELLDKLEDAADIRDANKALAEYRRIRLLP